MCGQGRHGWDCGIRGRRMDLQTGGLWLRGLLLSAVGLRFAARDGGAVRQHIPHEFLKN